MPSGTRRRFGARGCRRIRATGRGYFGQQQVVDLLAYLRLLHNRYDDVALDTVLASPFVGVSNDALVLLRRNAHARPLFTALERGLPEQLDPSDERLLRAFLQRYERLVRASARIGLEALCERIVSEHDYDLAVLARWDGTRRFANLRKLGRLARDYEAVRGADIEGLRPLRARPGRARCEGARGRRRGGGRRRRPAPDHPRREGPRVQGRHRRRRRSRRRRPARPGRDRRALGRPLRLPDGASDTRRPARRVRLGRRQGGGRRSGARGAAPPVLRRDDARDRPPDRLRRDRSRADGGPLDADRLGAGAARRARAPCSRPTSAPVELERGEARFVLTVARHRPSGRGDAAGGAPKEPGRAPTSSSSRSSTSCRPLVRASASSFPRSPRSRRPRATTSGGSRTARSRSSSAARTASTPSACSGSASRGERGGTGGGGGGLAATEIGDAVHRLLELVPLDAPALPRARRWTSGAVRAGTGASPTTSSSASRPRRRVLRVAARRRGSPACPARAGAAVHVRARRCPHPRPARRPLAGRRQARSSSTTSRTRSRAASRPRSSRPSTGCSGSSTRSSACAPARPRSRSRTSSSSGRRRRVDDVHARRRPRARGRALRRHRSHPCGRLPADAERVRLRGLPALDLVCAGPRLALAR